MKQLIGGLETKVEDLVSNGSKHSKGGKSKSENKSCKFCKKKGHIIEDSL